MNRIRITAFLFGAALLPALLVDRCVAVPPPTVLLDDSYEDELFLHDPNANGGLEVPNLPDETVFWVGRPADGIENNGVGAARILMNAASQKAWINFASTASPAYLDNGESLVTRIDYIPRGASLTNENRGWRWGLYYDPTDPIVETHNNNDDGGPGALAPYTDAEGYSFFVNMTGADPNTNHSFAQQAGKRTGLTNANLLGAAAAHTMVTGGSELVHTGNNEYTLEMIVTRVSDTLTTFTTSIYDKTGGNALLSTQTVNDDGAALGAAAAYRRFSFIGFRDQGTGPGSFAAFDFTNVFVQHIQVPEPATLLLGALMAPLTLLRRKR